MEKSKSQSTEQLSTKPYLISCKQKEKYTVKRYWMHLVYGEDEKDAFKKIREYYKKNAPNEFEQIEFGSLTIE